MNQKPVQDSAQYDDPGLYSTSSSLRQQQDASWVLGFLPVRSVARCLDIGCGDGAFLERLIQAGLVSEAVVGFDKSPQMVEAALLRLRERPARIQCEIAEADALHPPAYMHRFGRVSMLAVLHWLYPREQEAFEWIETALDANGVFCLTTYHPTVEGQAHGGTDDVVLEALARVSHLREFPTAFVPMGTRARPKAEIERMLRDTFQIVATLDRPAVTRASDQQQFVDYFQATFGSYYLQVLPQGLDSTFLRTLGQVAMERMESLGHVTSMDVRIWLCRHRST